MNEDHVLSVLQYENLYRKLTERHNGLIDLLAVLVKNFTIVPKGQCDSDGNEVYSGSVTDIARHVDLPEEIVWDLLQRKVVSSPIRIRDVDFLRTYRLLLGDEECPIGQKRSKRRPVARPDLDEPWRCWVYLRYLGHGNGDVRQATADKKIYVRTLRRDVSCLFEIPNTPELHQSIKAIRHTAYNDRRKVRDQGLSVVEVALQRGIKQESIQKYLIP